MDGVVSWTSLKGLCNCLKEGFEKAPRSGDIQLVVFFRKECVSRASAGGNRANHPGEASPLSYCTVQHPRLTFLARWMELSWLGRGTSNTLGNTLGSSLQNTPFYF